MKRRAMPRLTSTISTAKIMARSIAKPIRPGVFVLDPPVVVERVDSGAKTRIRVVDINTEHVEEEGVAVQFPIFNYRLTK